MIFSQSSKFCQESELALEDERSKLLHRLWVLLWPVDKAMHVRHFLCCFTKKIRTYVDSSRIRFTNTEFAKAGISVSNHGIKIHFEQPRQRQLDKQILAESADGRQPLHYPIHRYNDICSSHFFRWKETSAHRRFASINKLLISMVEKYQVYLLVDRVQFFVLIPCHFDALFLLLLIQTSLLNFFKQICSCMSFRLVNI